MINKNVGDDLHLNRLLFYLKNKLPFQVNYLKQIRKNVYLLKSRHKKWILKGFTSLQKLKVQEIFTASLKKEGFRETYLFLSDQLKEPLYFESLYYGIIEFIEPTKKSFDFLTDENRNEGLQLLSKFHHTTEKLVKRYKTLLSPYSQLERWNDRFQQFQQNQMILKKFIRDDYLDFYNNWGSFALAGIKNDMFFNSSEVIIHGDVAHHNFFRSFDNTLYLIDFDLISLGSKSIDYLQYANRILPAISWSFDELFKYNHLQNYLSEKAFLYALLFPTDVYREWNRVIRENELANPRKMQFLTSMTIGQFQQRYKFFKEVKNVIE